MRNSGRGHIEEIVYRKKKVVITEWHDNKRVIHDNKGFIVKEV